MNLLDANDRRGEYPDSWYAATARPLDLRPPLKGRITADLCIIGGGYTGLSAALHAAQAGLDVVLLEAQRLGFGASGRNGGQVGNGFNQHISWFERKFGPDQARQFYDLGQEAAALTRHMVREYAPDAAYKPGLVAANESASDQRGTEAEVALLQEKYGHSDITALDRDSLHALLHAPHYVGGSLDLCAGHLHPLRYAFGLARAAIAAGVRVFELSRVHDIDQSQPAIIRTDQGQVTAEHLIVATNGYGTGLLRQTRARVMPINNFIVATEPLGARAQTLLTKDYCVYDSRFVVNYFRLSEDGRLLFGGGENYGYRFPSDIAATTRKPMERVFPQLKGVKIDYAWGGTLAITMSRLPFIARPAPHVLTAAGYSGSGVAMAGLAGRLMADAIRGQAEGVVQLSSLPTPPFPGGGAFRSPLLALAMTWYALRDRLGI